MQAIFTDSQNLEKHAKELYSIPDFILMENAASEICNLIKHLLNNCSDKKILILCGKGNNGGDGFAVARKLQEIFTVKVLALDEPKTFEAKKQYEICQKLKINFLSYESFIKECYSADILLDCLYGTGFHGELNQTDKNLITSMNQSKGIRIACDIPSALYFNADYTVTMGELKLDLFSDKAKSVCGKIIVAPLGISTQKFTEFQTPTAFLLEETDIKLPLRKNKSVHKGCFGHAVTFAGEKAGAGIIGATAALNFGAGFSTIVKTTNSNLDQFKISPELIISEKTLPEKTTSIQIGSGLGDSEEVIKELVQWFENTVNPACVIDADLFNYPKLKNLLQKLNNVENSRIVLTPHPKELKKLTEKLEFQSENKVDIARFFAENYKNITLVMKGANTFIASNGQIFICTEGNQSLAKAGSGDVLAGLINALLAQGYSAKDAAITGVMVHAKASNSVEFKDSYSLTPEKLIKKISELSL